MHLFDSAKHCPPQSSGLGRAAAEAIRDLPPICSEVSHYIITERSANPRAQRQLSVHDATHAREKSPARGAPAARGPLCTDGLLSALLPRPPGLRGNLG